MKGHMHVEKLNKTGNYISALDYDRTFKGKENPEGYFKMLIQPITNADGLKQIKYMKTDRGYIVSGECYIISNGSEKIIDKRIKEYLEKYPALLHTEVKSEAELW